LGFGGSKVVDWGLVEGKVVELKVCDADAATDPVQPKEGPMGPHVEHHEGVDRNHLPTEITNCEPSKRDRGSAAEEELPLIPVVTPHGRRRSPGREEIEHGT